MPPKVKITKDAILKSAFNLTRKYGLDYVTAKSIAKDLHCSTQPIYWVFENMENLRKEIVVEANNLYNIYFHKKHENLHPLKAVGVNYILFAQEEPNLFKLLFMTDREKDISIFKSTLDDNKIEYLSMIKEIYDFNDEQANQYYVSMWIFSHGIATMLVSDLTAFTTEEISKLLTFTATSVIAKLKKGGDSMIEVKHLIKTFPNGDTRLYALNDLSFSIETGSFVVILGASGSGKTTLLNVLSGLDKADSGDINFNDTNISTFDEHELIKFRRENVGFIFQAYYLLPTLNVEANIKMGANLAKNKHYADLIASLGLCGKEQKFPFELSGGEQQRVSIARALAKQPQVLFCDEPTGALDEKTGRQIMRCLIDFQKQNKITLIMVTHNANFKELADRVIYMNSGKIISVNDNPAPLMIDEIRW